MKFLEAARLVLSLVPTLIAAVRAIEDALPDGGNGALKLEAVRGLLQSAYETATDQVQKFETVWPTLKRAIDVIVGLFNSVGLFKKGK
jgi:hypothetical protein